VSAPRTAFIHHWRVTINPVRECKEHMYATGVTSSGGHTLFAMQPKTVH
jgi:hypothetical protein